MTLHIPLPHKLRQGYPGKRTASPSVHTFTLCWRHPRLLHLPFLNHSYYPVPQNLLHQNLRMRGDAKRLTVCEKMAENALLTKLQTG